MEIFFLTSEGRAELPSRKVLTLDAARQFAASAEKHARENQWNVCIAIVDDGGHLICFQRMDETQYGSIVAAQQDGAIAQAGADALPNAAGR